MSDDAQKIKFFVSQELKGLSPSPALWVKDHLIELKPIELIENLDTDKKITMWLVTDHVGKQDSSYRVVFDSFTSDFGL